MLEKSILYWNYRGVRSRDFLIEMEELRTNYRPKLIILLEPRLSGEGANEVCKKIERSHWIRSESWGFSGEI